ncbi:MAG: carbohydrate-binding domain-containing protein [Gemmataceae bacterium]
MLKQLLSLAALTVVALATPAAEPIKLDLKNFKWDSQAGADLGGYDEGENRFFLYTNGTAVGDVEIPADGEYTITIEASCTAAEKELAKFKLTVGDVEVAKAHSLKAEEAKEYTFTAKLKKGKQKIKIEFLNDKYKENEYDLNLFLHAVKLEAKK